jgi:hypothetical protein
MSILRLVATFLSSLFKSKRQLVLENLALKQQVAMLRQSVRRPRATPADKLFWMLFARYVDGWRDTLHALHPDTVVRWHRKGFRLYWRWKCRGPKPGRSPIDTALRKLIREMQATNMGWGAPRIHGELLPRACYRAPATARLLPRVSLALAEPVCGTCYRIDSQRVPRSCDSPQRTAPTQNPSRLLRLLPYLQNSLVVEQRST